MIERRKQPKPDNSGPQGTIVFRASDVPGSEDAFWAQLNAGTSQSHLVGVTDPVKDMRFALRRGRTLVGRRDNNDIVLPEPSVSALHAWIINANDKYRVMNMLSTNGTFVNDRKVHEANLVHGDRVRFGSVEFVFQMGEHALRGGTGAPRVPRVVWAVVAIGIALSLAAFVFFRSG